MTQVFADDDQAGDLGMRGGGTGSRSGGPIPVQAKASRLPPALGPAMMPGKGVRPIRCVGCSRDTLPRNNDGAPLCQRCSELLASADSGLLASVTWSSLTRTSRSPRWRRRRTP